MSNYTNGKIPFRDRIAYWMCNFIISHLATKEYNSFVFMHTVLGGRELDRIFGVEQDV